MSSPRSASYDAVVIGAGLVGLATAWNARRLGMSVLVVERAEGPGAGASGVAAGMLAPVTEADFGEETALRLCVAGRERWPSFAAKLEEHSGLSTGFRETGALVVAADRDDAGELRRLHELQGSLGLATEWLSPSGCRRVEPGLSPRVAGGVLAAGDAQADPRATVGALAAAVEEIAYGTEVLEIEHEGRRATGVRTAGGTIAAGAVVVAAGAWSGALGVAAPPVRPVKGQILELRAAAGGGEPLDRIVRTARCYLVGRGDGRVVLGATMEEQGFDTTVTAGGIHRLLEAAWEVLPETAELEVVRVAAGLRPGTPDNLPVIGRGAWEGLLWATGHWRNGVLLAPLTGEAVAGMLAGGDPPSELSGLGPERFVATGAGAA